MLKPIGKDRLKTLLTQIPLVSSSYQYHNARMQPVVKQCKHTNPSHVHHGTV